MTVHLFEDDLMKLGLSDKEARVYVASLELGPSPVQTIAQKSGVKRATTYVAIESLSDRGLMSSFLKGKKTLFTAEPPKNLVSLLEEEKLRIEDKQKILGSILSDLIALGAASGGEPRVSFFQGVEGLRAIHEDILVTRDKSLENIVSLDDALKVTPPSRHVESFREKLEKRGVNVRILFSSKQGNIHLPERLLKKWSLRRVPENRLPLHGEVTLYGDKVAAFSYRGKIFGAIIESKEITQTVRVLFELAWSSGEVTEIKKGPTK